MAVQGTDVEALRAAVRHLEAAAAAVTAQLDRLVADEPPRPSGPSAPPVLQVIDDTAYPQDFWMDAEDEGLGGGR